MSLYGAMVTPRPGILEGAITAGDVFGLDESEFFSLYRLILHNDDTNAVYNVVGILQDVLGLSNVDATTLTGRAHNTGSSILAVEKLEDAEFYAKQLHNRGLIVTIESED